MRLGSDGAMQGGPVLRNEGERVASRKVCQDSNPSHRAPNKLRKGHRSTLSSASSRIRFVCSRQSSDSSRSRTTAGIHNSPSPSRSKSRSAKTKSQSAPNTRTKNVVTNYLTQEPPKLPESMESRGRTSKLQKRFSHEKTYKKPQNVRQEEHSRANKRISMSRHDKKSPMGAVATVSSGARLAKRQRIRPEGQKKPRASSLASRNTNESPRSSTSDTWDNVNAYMLSSLDVLSARPTLKCASRPRYVPSNTYAIGYTEHTERMRGKINIPDDLMTNDRVSHIADRLSTHELRELMERDQKRRKKKVVAEAAHTERQLCTRAESQLVDKDRSPQKPKDIVYKDVFKQERSGIRVRSESITKKEKEYLGQHKPRIEKRASYPFKAESFSERSSGPVKEYHIVSEPAEVALNSTSNQIEPTLQTNLTKKSGRSNVSQYLASRLSTSSSTPTVPTDKENQTKDKPPQTWSFFFKHRNKDKRASVPRSFSTTSCDFLPPGENPHSCYTSMKSTSSIPRRTVSKFREDLPEFSVSSQSSRIISSESPDLQGTSFMPVVNQLSSEPFQKYNNDTPISESKPIDIKKRHSENSRDDNPTDDAYQFHHLSQSLASIDSEASWLSGGRGCVKRNSKKSKKKARINSRSQKMFHQDKLESQKHSYKSEISEDDNFCHGSIFSKDFQGESPRAFDEDGVNEIYSEQTRWGAVARRPHITHRSSISGYSGHVLLNDVEADIDSISVHNSMVASQKSSSRIFSFEKPRSQGLFAATLDSDNQHPEDLSNTETRDLKTNSFG
ncbi:hypothetical protein GcC1_180024 [Golovinomyces cichoracearum]|uniref:Uncharacterized protein n=1 Tax=Golovinomyces cichoracearum TaxID=62708 RepID=A0A420HMV6_9PEZI|nr:hypothetical protein GcC1_180024 [Golovinomyces cichoracearum]